MEKSSEPMQVEPQAFQGNTPPAELKEGGQAVEIKQISEKTVIPAAVAQPRQFFGSVRNQFASVLQSHFLACLNPEPGTLLDLFNLLTHCICVYFMHSC
jgi:hypothetical protein